MGVQKEAISEGVGGCLKRFFFSGVSSKIGDLLINNSFSVEQAISYFPVTGVSKQVLLFGLVIFYLAPCTYPVVMVTVGAARTYQPFPSTGFCFQLLLERRNTWEGLNVINDPKCNKVLNVLTFCPKCNKLFSCQLQ